MPRLPEISIFICDSYRETGGKNTRHVEESETSLDFITFVPTTDKINASREEASLLLVRTYVFEIPRKFPREHE
jgi:hypothetical protein